MSCPVKVPEALYVSLCEEAERNGVTVMAALEARLQPGAGKLATLTADRERLGNTLNGAKANLDRAEASHRACRADAERLQGEVQRLRLALGDREKRITRLEETVATERKAAGELRDDAPGAERKARNAQVWRWVLFGALVCCAAAQVFRRLRRSQAKPGGSPVVRQAAKPAFVWPERV